MNRLIIIAVLLASGCTMAFSQYVDTRRLITVSGEARTDLPPDIAYVTIGVEIDGLDIHKIRTENDAKVRAIIGNVKSAGIPGKDIQTSALSIQPVYNYSTGRQELVTYRMRNSVTITIRDLQKVEQVLSANLSGGSNILNSLVFASTRADAVRDSLRVEATKNARNRAMAIATAAGASLGHVVTIHAASSGDVPVREYMRSTAQALMAKADTETPVEAGELAMRVSVEAVFEMQ